MKERLYLFDTTLRDGAQTSGVDFSLEDKLQVAKTRGEFVWHSHPDTDDFFLVLAGQLTIQLRDRDVVLGPGELFVVPRGVEHCPRADDEAHVLLIEAEGTPNTGDSTERDAAPEIRLD